MYYYGARYYDPRISIFVSVDPLAEDFAGWTPYHYVHNNPINLIDPTGMAADGWIEQNKDGKTTVTFDPNVNTPEEAKAAGYDNVSQVLPSGTLHGQYNLNSDGSVCGDDAKWSRSQRYGGMSFFWADKDTEVRTYNSDAWNSESAQFSSWQRGASGAITPMGGVSELAGMIIYEYVQETTGSSELAFAAALFAPGAGKGANRLKPNPAAVGAHSTFSRGLNGRIFKYETYEMTKNGFFNPVKRFDGGLPNGGAGAAHTNKSTLESIPTPHVQGKTIPGGVRRAEIWEIPK
ncbi:RHS repeat-associated core domain-containing protein [Paenimyroides baculatum]|uniref:RHS repeat-associated core domain-containing protein n=1 Tax=Paenimyroides baculatum TaxID=2608000 RepID=A0A5M6CQX2_9FLAO|nr:hypothetical protein F0460_07245 [Paenimyroides baculatum]